MQKMSAKEYLQQAFNINRTIQTRKIQIEELRASATNISPHSDSVQVCGSSNRGNRMMTVDKLVDIQRLLEKESKQLSKKYIEIKAIIDTVENETYRDLLTLRYLAFKKWEEIARVMGYELRNIYYLHGRALQQIKFA